MGRAFAGACWAAALACFLLPISNPDLFWHLSAARRMAATGAIPRTDWLSYTMAGRPWTDFEWLCQLLWYATLRVAGLWGLVFLKAALLGAAAASLWGLMALHGAAVELRGLVVLAWAVAISPANDLRPENLSLAFFGLEFWALEARRVGRLRISGRACLAAAAGAYCVWANCHPGFLYGLALLALYAAAEWGRSRRTGLALAAAACFAATWVNPFGPDLFRVFGEHLRELGSLERYIREWRSPTLFDPWLWTFWAVLAAAFAAILARFLQDREVPPEQLAAVTLSAWSAAGHVRAAPYFLAIGVPVAALHGSKLDFRRLGGRATARGAVAAAAAALFWFFGARIAPELGAREPFAARFIPRDLGRFLRDERATLGGLRLLNPWHWGGYLGWEFHPDYKPFVDGRYIFHPLLREREEATRSPEAYRAFLDRYRIDLVLLEREPQFFKMPFELSGGRKLEALRPFYLVYLPKKEWALVYWDPRNLAFVRRSAAPAAWVRTHEFALLRPDDLRIAALKVRERLVPWSGLAGEVERYLRLNPASPDAAALRAWLASVKPGREKPSALSIPSAGSAAKTAPGRR